ncbi:MAG: di-trans,poly-cis-decaprenylcistransferase [Candidatus Aminicenantes bacterium RBG_13_63_10]|nr:MAG: di-trans,poly-cis-decaprenylcistransferase [Candidatus Aminicenantes bacterium RBG_13_63_10]
MLEKLKDYIEPGSPEERLAGELDAGRIPRHVAVIMDGNGRWARERNLPRLEGHRAGAKSVREAVEACARLGIEVLTLFAFSRENWKRPRREVATLWKLLEEYLKKEGKVLMENNFRLTTIGRLEEIPENVRGQLERVAKLTSSNTGLHIVLALNYSGRMEIVEAVRRWARQGVNRAEDLDEESFSRFLDTAGLPDPDLLIRTSGECRVSNFLLWQIAYSEIWITKVYWPDFRKIHLLEALVEFQKRERRFGALSPSRDRA